MIPVRVACLPFKFCHARGFHACCLFVLAVGNEFAYILKCITVV
jgi:hypothetical protein